MAATPVGGHRGADRRATSGVVVVNVNVRESGSGFDAPGRAASSWLADGCAGLGRTPPGCLHGYYPASRDVERRCWPVADFRGGLRRRFPITGSRYGCGRANELVAVAAAEPYPTGVDLSRRVLDPPRRAASGTRKVA